MIDVLQHIDAYAHTSPWAIAHATGDQRLTYSQLRERSDALAGYFAETLPDDRSPIVVYGHKESEMLVGFLGAVKSGHPYVPVDTIVPRPRLDSICSTAGASLVVTPDDIRGLSAGRRQIPRRMFSPSDPFYIIFTSGSTGEPKGAVITHGNLATFVGWMTAEHHFRIGREVFLNQAIFSFDLSVMDLYLSLVTGGTLFSLNNDDVANPKDLYRRLSASGVTTWVSTPSFAQMCLNEPSFGGGRLPAVHRFLFCGEILPPQVALQLIDRFPGAEVWNTYGPTEATVATTSVRIDRDAAARMSPLPAGRAMPGTRVCVFDEASRDVEPGRRGEIVIIGPNVSAGYIGRPDLTARSFFEQDGMRAYRTGDWGHYDGDLLFCDGRMDSQIKLHGYRIEIADIEANLRCLPEIRDAAVIPVLKDGRPDSLLAFVILSEPHGGSELEIGRRLRVRLGERLPPYMVPRRFRALAAFPLTPNGKADRRKLAESIA